MTEELVEILGKSSITKLGENYSFGRESVGSNQRMEDSWDSEMSGDWWKRTLMSVAGQGASYRICVLSLKTLGVYPDLASPVQLVQMHITERRGALLLASSVFFLSVSFLLSICLSPPPLSLFLSRDLMDPAIRDHILAS